MKKKEKYKHLHWLIDAFYEYEWNSPLGLEHTKRCKNNFYMIAIYSCDVKIEYPYKYQCGFFESLYIEKHWKE